MYNQAISQNVASLQITKHNSFVCTFTCIFLAGFAPECTFICIFLAVFAPTDPQSQPSLAQKTRKKALVKPGTCCRLGVKLTHFSICL